jgi:hypothetical protein
MRKFGFVLVGVLLLATVCKSQTNMPTMIGFTWPGNHGMVGTCAGIEIRRAVDSLTANSWFGATIVPTNFIPKVSGTRDSAVIDSVFKTETLYFIVARWTSTAGAQSGNSNIVRLYKTEPPATMVLTVIPR